MNWRLAALGMLAVSVVASASLRVSAAEPALVANLECTPVAGPGRVLCKLTARAALGKLAWVDALVVRAPPFAPPLRARVVAEPRAAADPDTAEAKLALVATELGSGKLELLVRSVICHENASGEQCGPEVLAVSAAVSVGPTAAPAP
jgi:hypothetical protein